MRQDHFEAMVRRMAEDIPHHYLDGVAAIDVSAKRFPHPVRAGVYTLGECIPIEAVGGEVTSRIVLYYGSFRALAADRPAFEWRAEAWETLTHELRHHLEWRADTARLDEYDWAAEQNFARIDGQPYDPLFYRAGERLAERVYRVDDDVFVERPVSRVPGVATLAWHGRSYRVAVPSGSLPLDLVLEGLDDPPPGDVILAFRRRPGIWSLWRRPAPPRQRHAAVETVP